MMTKKDTGQLVAHLTGIKGVGMTALALCLQDMGYTVSGSDTSQEFITDKTLKARGIQVKVGFDPNTISPNTTYLVYTGAHQGKMNPEVVYAEKNGIEAVSLAEATGRLMKAKKGISVCGVGGKTTTTALLATIFEQNGKSPSYLIGVSTVSTLAYPGQYHQQSDHCILEADEYATSPGINNTPRFMYQTPKTIICTNISHDHPDIYPRIEDTLQAYQRFFAKLPSDGVCIYNADCHNTKKIISAIPCKQISVGWSASSTYRLTAVTAEQGKLIVRYSHQGEENQLTLSIPGEYNARNALMALACAREEGIALESIKTSIDDFKGVERRFQKKAEQGGVVFYDDYAHHPTEIESTLKAAKQWFANRRVIAIFQPHTYSRTKTLIDQFANSFGSADVVVVTDIFASAREAYDATISAEMLVEKISQHHPKVYYMPKESLVKSIKKIIQPSDIVITIGAGDVYEFHQQYANS